MILIGIGVRLQGQESETGNWQITAGPEFLIYQSAYNFQSAPGLEVTAGGPIKGPLAWQGGVRIGFDPVLPEMFGRVMATHEFRAWAPAAGLELGVSGRAKFEGGSNLLKETREAMQVNIGSVYLSVHAAPAKFSLKKGWTVSALEIGLGTHFSNFGRTLRARIGLFTIGKRF
jgi:hypothetical protein